KSEPGGRVRVPRRDLTREAPMSMTPIADYALISDCHSAAVVSRGGSIDWLCRPPFDSPAVFARILDQSAGHHSIAPTGAFTAERRYLDRTMVLETTFRTAEAPPCSPRSWPWIPQHTVTTSGCSSKR